MTSAVEDVYFFCSARRARPSILQNQFAVCLSGVLGIALLSFASPAEAQGICDRTQQVRNAILNKIPGINDCADVTDAHLAGIRGDLYLRYQGIKELNKSDFASLGNLRSLNLANNRLGKLPPRVFADLRNLRELRLYRNWALRDLPAEVFSSLANLRILDMEYTSLGKLPAGIFSNLRALRQLRFHDAGISELPPGAFSGLGKLGFLSLAFNQLEELPSDVFSGLHSLDELRLDGNPGTPFRLKLGFENTAPEALGIDSAELRLTLLEGAPFAANVSVSVRGGSISSTRVSFSAGSTRSSVFTVTRNAGEVAVVTLIAPEVSVNKCVIGSCRDHFEIVADASFILDDTGPAEVSGARIISMPQEGDFYSVGRIGVKISVEVSFDEEVIVTPAPGGPALELEIGDTIRTATYDSNFNSTNKLVFSYAPVTGDSDTDGISIAANALELNGARIVDRSLINADLSLGSHAISNDAGHKVQYSPDGLSLWVESAVRGGEDAEVFIQAIPALESEVIVGYGVGKDGDTASTQDYLVGSGSVTLPAGSTTGVIRIQTVNDEDIGLSRKSFTVFLTEPAPGTGYVIALPTEVEVVIREEGICDRTRQVRAAILKKIPGVSRCVDVTDAHLAGIEGMLDLNRKNIRELNKRDFAGLRNLQQLRLNDNPVLGNLPAGVFSDLASLQLLYLWDTSLRELPAGTFSNLGSLRRLSLYIARITQLPAGIFSDLGELEFLSLTSNWLEELPPGVFSGLSNLNRLLLSGNPGSSFRLQLGFEGIVPEAPGVDSVELRLTLLEGAPFAMGVGFSVQGGAVSPTRTSFSTGSTRSSVFTVTRNAGEAVTVTPIAPEVPAGNCGRDVCYTGFEIVAETLFILDDTGPAEVSDVRITSSPRQGDTYVAGGAGEQITVKVGFNETVTVTPAPGGPALTLEIGDTTRTAVYVPDQSAPTTLVFNYAPAVGDPSDADGISIAPDALALNGARIVDRSLINANVSLGSHAILNAGGHKVERSTRSAVSFRVASAEVAEGQNARIAVGTILPAQSDVVVGYEVGRVGDTGDAGDYTDPGNGRVTIPAGSKVGFIEIAITNDVEAEPVRESLTVSLSAPGAAAGYVLRPPLTAEVVIKEGVCDRTWQIRDALTARVSDANGCADVTAAGLRGLDGELNLRDSNVRTLKRGDFGGVVNLRALYLYDNRLSELPGGVFRGLNNLRYLYLERNRLDTLSADSFAGLPALRELHLASNRLEFLPVGVFSPLTRLQWLDLEGNRLSRLDADIFRGLHSLEQLDLEENRLSTLPASVFRGLRNLGDLDLEYNRLGSLPEGMFNGLGNLQKLYLFENRLSDLPNRVFFGLYRLNTLYLSGNPGASFMLTPQFGDADPPVSASGASRLRLTLREGAPFDIAIRLSAEGGSLSSDEVTLPTGHIESVAFSVTQSGSRPVTVRMDTVSDSPGCDAASSCYLGVATGVGATRTIDRRGAAVSGVAFLSSPEEGVYLVSERETTVISVGVGFNEEVEVSTSSGGPALVLKVGEATRVAVFSAVSTDVPENLSTLVFNYELAPEDFDDDGVSIGPDALILAGAVIADAFGNEAEPSLGVHAVSDAAGHKVRRIPSVAFDSTPVSGREATTVTLLVGLTAPAYSTLTVHYGVGAVGDTGDGKDHTAGNGGSFTVSTGATTGAVVIGIKDDTRIEPPRESFTVFLTEPASGAGYVLGSPTTATVIIEEGVCNRTSQVQKEIVRIVENAHECSEVTAGDLASLTRLLLGNSGITGLQKDDFLGLHNLQRLDLGDNTGLTSLPAGIFSRLINLQELDMDRVGFEMLPAGLFLGLKNLRVVNLYPDSGIDFSLAPQFDRVSTSGVPFPGGAEVRLTLMEGAPFDLTVGLSVDGGAVSSKQITLQAGSTASEVFLVTQDEDEPVTVTMSRLQPSCGLRDCRGFGVSFDSGKPFTLHETLERVALVFEPGVVEIEQGGRTAFSVTTIPKLKPLQWLTLNLQAKEGGFGFIFKGESELGSVVALSSTTPAVTVTATSTAAIGQQSVVELEVSERFGFLLETLPTLTLLAVTPTRTTAFSRNARFHGGTQTSMKQRSLPALFRSPASGGSALGGVLPPQADQPAALVFSPSPRIEVEQGGRTTFSVSVVPELVLGESLSLRLSVLAAQDAAQSTAITLDGSDGVSLRFGDAAEGIVSRRVSVEATATAVIGSTATVVASEVAESGISLEDAPSLKLTVVTPRATVSFVPPGPLVFEADSSRTVTLGFRDYELQPGQQARLRLQTKGVGFSVYPATVTLSADAQTAEVSVHASQAATFGVLKATATQGVELLYEALLELRVSEETSR